jgi:hypothetical protein
MNAGHHAKGRGMEIGETTSAVIDARELGNDTGIHLIAGQPYYFRAEGEWVDWFRTCDADGYDSVNWVQEMSESLRRSPRDRWFVLIGSLGRGTGRLFRIGKDSIFSPDSTADLFCFANDVALAYGNTRGNVELTVTRVG